MLLGIMKGLVAVCMLNNFNGLPSKIEGNVVMKTSNFVVLRLNNADNTEIIEITVAQDKCKIKE